MPPTHHQVWSIFYIVAIVDILKKWRAGDVSHPNHNHRIASNRLEVEQNEVDDVLPT